MVKDQQTQNIRHIKMSTKHEASPSSLNMVNKFSLPSGIATMTETSEQNIIRVTEVLSVEFNVNSCLHITSTYSIILLPLLHYSQDDN